MKIYILKCIVFQTEKNRYQGDENGDLCQGNTVNSVNSELSYN